MPETATLQTAWLQPGDVLPCMTGGLDGVVTAVRLNTPTPFRTEFDYRTPDGADHTQISEDDDYWSVNLPRPAWEDDGERLHVAAADMRLGDFVTGLGPVCRIGDGLVWFRNQSGQEERLYSPVTDREPWLVSHRGPALEGVAAAVETPVAAVRRRPRRVEADPDATARSVDVAALAERPADWAPLASQRTFGVELECYLPEGRCMGDLAAFITANGVRCRAADYGHGAPRHWKIVSDGSLSCRGCEIVSPILRGDDGLDQCRKVCAALVGFGCTVNLDCGYHVHIGVDETLQASYSPTPEAFAQLRAVCALWMRHESDLDAVLPPSRRGESNRWCKSNRAWASGTRSYTPAAGEAAFQRVMGCRDLRALHSLVNPDGRYFKLNLTPLRGEHGMQPTIEFRHHSGTADPAKVTHWAKLMLAFVDKAASAHPRAWDFTADHGQRDSLRRLLRYVKPGADTHAFFMRRRLELARADGRARATDGLGFATRARAA